MVAKKNKADAAKPKMDFEAQLKRLQDIVRQLEQGELPLEQGVELFKEGTELAKACRKRLEEAKSQVEILSEGVLKEFQAPDQAPDEAGDQNDDER